MLGRHHWGCTCAYGHVCVDVTVSGGVMVIALVLGVHGQGQDGGKMTPSSILSTHKLLVPLLQP